MGHSCYLSSGVYPGAAITEMNALSLSQPTQTSFPLCPHSPRTPNGTRACALGVCTYTWALPLASCAQSQAVMERPGPWAFRETSRFCTWVIIPWVQQEPAIWFCWGGHGAAVQTSPGPLLLPTPFSPSFPRSLLSYLLPERLFKVKMARPPLSPFLAIPDFYSLEFPRVRPQSPQQWPGGPIWGVLPLGGLQSLASGRDLVSRGPGDGMSWDTEGTEGMVLERPLNSPSRQWGE